MTDEQRQLEELDYAPATRLTLRLSQILRDLAQDEVPESAHVAESPDLSRRQQRKQRRRQLKEIKSEITLGEIIDRTRHAGFGFLSALLALVSIPFPFGLSLPMGLAIALNGGQMIAGRRRPWLPKRIRARAVSLATLEWLSVKVARYTAGLERWIKPRLTLFLKGPAFGMIGAAMIFHGIGLALPLPIPASNWIFIVPIVCYAVGLLETDGILIMVGHLVTVAYVTLAVIFYQWTIDLFKGLIG